MDPTNIQGLHNLCVVYVERGNLATAAECLHRVHQLAPHEEYILKHLKIVQTRLRQNGITTKENTTPFNNQPISEFDTKSEQPLHSKPATSIALPLSESDSDGLQIDESANHKKDIPSATSSSNTRAQHNYQQKFHKSKQLIVDNHFQRTTTRGMLDVEQPIFVESSKTPSSIPEDHRQSKSGKDKMNRRTYQTQPHLNARPKTTSRNSNTYIDQPIFANDLDDPSSGMS